MKICCEFEPNDVVFSFCDAYIKAAGLATERATSTPKPDFGSAGKSWSEEGWLVPVEFREFAKPLRPKAHIEELKPYLPNKYSPLKPTGDGLQAVYLTELPQPLAEQLIRLLGKQYESILEELSTDVSIDNSEDSQERLIKGRTDIGPTAKEQLVKARRGQGIFRANVRLNEKGCRVTKVVNPTFLRASHIKPWKDSSDAEKLDGCNGLLLAPHVDHLFDKGLISFSNSGDLLISPRLDEEILKAWGIASDLNVGNFNVEQSFFSSTIGLRCLRSSPHRAAIAARLDGTHCEDIIWVNRSTWNWAFVIDRSHPRSTTQTRNRPVFLAFP